MAYASRSLVELQLSGRLDRLREHAAVVRSLLDELDRMIPMSGVGPRGGSLPALREQLADELVRLGCQLLQYAAEVAGVSPFAPTGRA